MAYIIYSLVIIIGGGTQSGAPMSMRARKVGGAVRNSRVFSRVRSLCAQFGCVNHCKFNGRPSLRVPPGSFDATCIIILRTGSCVRAFRRSYQNCVGALPPQVKYCGGACPPCPPGSAAYDNTLDILVIQ